MGTLFLQREKGIRGEGRRWERVSVGLSVCRGKVSSACVPFLRAHVCRLHPAPPGQTPSEQIHRGRSPNPESGFPAAETPLPRSRRLCGRSITITTAQLGRWIGRAVSDSRGSPPALNRCKWGTVADRTPEAGLREASLRPQRKLRDAKRLRVCAQAGIRSRRHNSGSALLKGRLYFFF